MTEFQGFNEDAQTNPVLDTYERVLTETAAQRVAADWGEVRRAPELADKLHEVRQRRDEAALAEKYARAQAWVDDPTLKTCGDEQLYDRPRGLIGEVTRQQQAAAATRLKVMINAMPTPEQRALDLAVESLLEAHGVDCAKQFDGPRGAGGAMCHNVLGNSYTGVHAQGYFAEALADFITRFEPVVKDAKQLAWYTRPKITRDGDVWVAEAHLYVWKG